MSNTNLHFLCQPFCYHIISEGTARQHTDDMGSICLERKLSAMKEKWIEFDKGSFWHIKRLEGRGSKGLAREWCADENDNVII